MVDFHPVAAAPRMPAGSPNHAGVGCVNGGAARRRVVLAKVEIPCRPRQRTDTEPERRAGIQEGKRSHQETCRRPADTGQLHGHRGLWPAPGLPTCGRGKATAAPGSVRIAGDSRPGPTRPDAGLPGQVQREYGSRSPHPLRISAPDAAAVRTASAEPGHRPVDEALRLTRPKATAKAPVATSVRAAGWLKRRAYPPIPVPQCLPIDWLQKVATRAFLTVHLMGPYGRTGVNP